MFNLFKKKDKIKYVGLNKLAVVETQPAYVVYDTKNKAYLSGYRLSKDIKDANAYTEDKANLIVRIDGRENGFAYEKRKYGTLKTFHFPG